MGIEKLIKYLPKSIQKAYWDRRKAAYFNPKNAVGSKEEKLSLSGRHILRISYFSTDPGSWNYSQGVVYRADGGEPIATVQRNYDSFPYLFVEGHPKGDFLVCGKDYQGQTVINLTTGARRDLMSDGSKVGGGFCWSSYVYDAPNQLLIVNGCHWGAPYEHRFYDFSDPMNGWPEVTLSDSGVDADERKDPELDPDGTLRTFMTRYTEDDEDDETDEEAAEKPRAEIVDVICTYKREGSKFKLIEKWVSDYEKDRRVRQQESSRKWEEWKAHFKATDPLYLTYAELVKDPKLSPETYDSLGFTYYGWSPDWKGEESRWCRRIITHKGKNGVTVDLEWATDTGPIKIDFFRDGNSAGHQFFEHSVDGMKQAFSVAKEFAKIT